MNSQTLSKLLRWMVYGAAIMPLVIFSQYISPFHFGKVILFRSWVEIMLVLYLLLIWRDRSFLPRRDNIFWAFLGFTLVFTLTTLASINTFQSFWGTLERMGGLFSFWHYFVFYIIITSVLKTKEHWKTFFKVTVWVGLLSAFYGFGQRTDIEFFIGSGGRERIFGTLGNAALFAGYQILNVFIALVMGLESTRSSERKFYLASAALMTLAVFMTVVRGSLLGIIAGFLIFAFLYFNQTHSRLAKKALFSIIGFVILFVIFSFAFRDSAFVQNSGYLRRVTDFSPNNPTVQTRIWAWQAGLKGWSESPKTILVGWGPETFNIPFSKHFNPGFFKGIGSETFFDRAHNMFVEVLVTMGLLGLLAYLWIFVTLFRTLWNLKQKPEYRYAAIGFIAMTVAYIIHNSFIFDTSANFFVFFSVLGFISYLSRQESATNQSIRPKPRGYALAAVVLAILCLVLIYQANIKTAKANYATTRGILAGWANNFSGAVTKYREATSFEGAGRYEYRNRFAQYLLDYSPQIPNITPDIKAVFEEAIALEEKNARENPHDYLPELYLARLNIILGRSDPKSPYNDKALEHALKALNYSPTFIRTHYEVGQAYLNKQDFPKALEAFQRAVDLNPNTLVSHWYLGAANISAGNVDKGLEIIDYAISRGYKLTKENYFMIANHYIRANNYARLVPVYIGLIELEPNNASYRASLAVAYARLGRIDDAVREAKLAAQIDPSFEPEARRFVQSLGRAW